MRLLHTANVCGTEWQVVEATPAEFPDLEGLQGSCDPALQTVYVNSEAVAPAGYPMVVAHELAHASIVTSGGKDTLRVISGFKGARLEALEEFIVGTLLHAVYDTFTRNNWLNIPLSSKDT